MYWFNDSLWLDQQLLRSLTDLPSPGCGQEAKDELPYSCRSDCNQQREMLHTHRCNVWRCPGPFHYEVFFPPHFHSLPLEQWPWYFKKIWLSSVELSFYRSSESLVWSLALVWLGEAYSLNVTTGDLVLSWICWSSCLCSSSSLPESLDTHQFLQMIPPAHLLPPMADSRTLACYLSHSQRCVGNGVGGYDAFQSLLYEVFWKHTCLGLTPELLNPRQGWARLWSSSWGDQGLTSTPTATRHAAGVVNEDPDEANSRRGRGGPSWGWSWHDSVIERCSYSPHFSPEGKSETHSLPTGDSPLS